MLSTQREEDRGLDIPLGCLFIIKGKDILRNTRNETSALQTVADGLKDKIKPGFWI